jgi:hypothetical protein
VNPESQITDDKALSLLQIMQSSKKICRQSITFILGEDKKKTNPYYTEATNYYLHNDSGKTTYVETQCRSLSEVREYLINHRPTNKLPWGLINLVSHGDQWLGLSVKVTPDSKRSTLDRILEHIEKGTFQPLSDSVIDSHSEIFIHACGVGNNADLVEAIAVVFRGKKELPKVRATRLFEFYSSIQENGQIKETQRYLSNAWFIYHKKGYEPGMNELCTSFHTKYPHVQIDWQEALTREQPRWAGDPYCYKFDIPVDVVLHYASKESLPDISSEDKKLALISTNPEIKETLRKIEISAENFEWELKKGYANNSNGKRSPAILIKGYCTILCVLKPLAEEHPNNQSLNKPITPSLEDTSYYFTFNRQSNNVKR